MSKKPKQREQLPLDLPEARPPWKISPTTKLIGQHWLPIARKRLDQAKKKEKDNGG